MPRTTNPLMRRKSSTPAELRRKSLAARDDAADRLGDTGLAPSLAPPGVSQDVISLVRHVQEHTWDEVPDRAAGMNSVRIAVVLRFRTSLPPTVSLAHLHAVSVSSTTTERELARLMAEGRVRKLVVPGRGKGGAAAGEGVVLVEDWQSIVRGEPILTDELKEKYCQLMDAHPSSTSVPATGFKDDEVRQLVAAGYLTSPTALSTSTGNAFTPPNLMSFLSVSKAGSTAASGSMAAIGGQGAVHDSGGGGSTLATKVNRSSGRVRLHDQQTLTFSLPTTGAYLKLLTEARLHLLHQLKQLSPRYKEATRDMLKEKWEGNVLGDATSILKRARGQWTGVLPGKTRKWRDFYGLRFGYVLEECVGAGLVELFETGSVGVAVRAR